MRKIPEKYDDKLDNLLYRIADLLCPFAFYIGMTPNMITTLSLISCIISITLLLKKYYIWACLFLFLSYYFDCMDGHMARKYNMVTVFGDYYDHISDVLKLTAVLITLYYINKTKFFRFIPIIIILAILMTRHLGCQELLYNKDQSPTLSNLKSFCPVNNPNNMSQVKKALLNTRFFGCGTFYTGLLLMIIYYKY
jgi:hypothetical protein